MMRVSFNKDVSRREAMKTAAKGAAYAAPVVLAATVPAAVSAATPAPPANNAAAIKSIFTIARTAEQLAVTFYTNGVKNAAALGLTPTQLGQIQAALVEEQLHQILFTAQGGDSLADTFSFPQGARTFTDLQTFIATQQMLEGVFDSAFLAAVREFSELGQPRLAQIASQIATVESDHRTLGRAIAGLEPADNWTYAPVLVSFVADAPAAVTAAGFLKPGTGERLHLRCRSTRARRASSTKTDHSPSDRRRGAHPGRPSRSSRSRAPPSSSPSPSTPTA